MRIFTKNLFLGFWLVFTNAILHAQVPTYVPQNGLVAWYPFTGNADDLSGNNHHAVVNGAMQTTDRFGNKFSAYEFYGNFENLKIDDVLLPNTPNSYSISFWMQGNPYLADLISDRGTANYSYKYRFVYDPISGQTYKFFTANTTMYHLCAYSGAVSNNWQHFVMVLDITQNQMRLYRNAQLVSTHTNFYYPSNSTATYIGKSVGPQAVPDPSFNGKLDDFGFWNRVLSPSEIQDLYCATTITTQPSNANVAVGSNAVFYCSASSPSTYQWQINTGSGWQNIVGGGQFTGETTSILTVNNVTSSNATNQFRCLITSNIGSCDYISSVAILNGGTSISVIKNDEFLQIYPNPVLESMTLKVHPSFIGAQATVIDVLGRAVLKFNITEREQTINISSFVPGNYYLKIHTEDNRLFKIIKL